MPSTSTIVTAGVVTAGSPGSVATLAAANVNSMFSATCSTAVGSTVNSAQTGQRDIYNFVDGVGAAMAKAVVDPYIIITSNSTTFALSSTATTSGGVFAYTSLKGLRLYNSPTNDQITITSNISGFPACKLPPGSYMVWATESANGIAIASGNTITAAGTTGNIAVITMIVS
jgi:hypothetical protein